MSTTQDNRVESESESVSYSSCSSSMSSQSESETTETKKMDGEHDEYDTDSDCNDLDDDDEYDEYDEEVEKYKPDHLYVNDITKYLHLASECNRDAVESVCSAMKLPFVTADTFIAHAERFGAETMASFYSNRSVGKSNVKVTKPFNTWRIHIQGAYQTLNVLTWLRSCPRKLDRLRRHALKMETNYAEYDDCHRSMIPVKDIGTWFTIDTCVEYTCGCMKVIGHSSYGNNQGGWVRCDPHSNLCAEYKAAVREFYDCGERIVNAVNQVRAESTRKFHMFNGECSIGPGDDNNSSAISMEIIAAASARLPTEFTGHLDPRFDELRNLVPVDQADPNSKPSIYPWNNRIRYVRARAGYMRNVGFQDAKYVVN